MSMLTDEEQSDLLDEEDANHWQRVSREVIEAIKQSTQPPSMSTDELMPHIVNALKKSGYAQKIERVESFVERVKRGLNGIVK